MISSAEPQASSPLTQTPPQMLASTAVHAPFWADFLVDSNDFFVVVDLAATLYSVHLVQVAKGVLSNARGLLQHAA